MFLVNKLIWCDFPPQFQVTQFLHTENGNVEPTRGVINSLLDKTSGIVTLAKRRLLSDTQVTI